MKIWRYVDSAKFIHMLATGTLYFPCVTTELKDPYEGWLPRSHMKARADLNRIYLDQMRSTRDCIIALHPTRDPAPLDAVLEDAERKLDQRRLMQEVNSKFGVNCWHINEYESEAMWQIYTAAGQGIAIESTKAKLESALKGDGIIVDQMRYMDFDRDEIEKGHRHYGLFCLDIVSRGLRENVNSCDQSIQVARHGGSRAGSGQQDRRP